jgi:hypothetical protein
MRLLLVTTINLLRVTFGAFSICLGNMKRLAECRGLPSSDVLPLATSRAESIIWFLTCLTLTHISRAWLATVFPPKILLMVDFWLIHKYWNTTCIILYLFIFSGFAAQRGLCPPRSRGFFVTHNDAPQSVELLWTSDQLVAETCTRQHATHTTDKYPCPRWDSKP